VRRWVLTLPRRVRYGLAWDHALCRAVVGVFMRAVLGFLRRRAREQQGVTDGRGGAVVIVQRFGAALNLNVHSHALVVDGVFAEDGSGGLRFHPAAPPTDEEMEGVLGTIERRIRRVLARHGVTDDDAGDSRSDPLGEESPVLAGLAGASVQGRIGLGPRAGAEVRRCGAALGGPLGRRRCSGRVTLTRTGSICTPGSSLRLVTGRGWNACAGTPCGHQWRTIASA
jgi:hypothetical protein